MGFFQKVIDHPLITVAGNRVTLAALTAGLLVIVCGLLVSYVARRFARARLSHMLSLETGTGYAITRMFHYIVVSVAILIGLQTMGFSLAGLTVLGGFIGVGLGFGLQNVTSNFVSGIILLFEQPIRVGDEVTAQEYFGTVTRIGMRSTTVRTLDNITLILPNTTFIQERVINWSLDDPKIRVHIPFGVAYGSDVQKVRQTALAAAGTVERVMKDPAPEVFFIEFADSSLNFALLVWIEKPSGQFRVKSEIYYALEAALRANAIEIPFPQRDLHVRSAATLEKLMPSETPPVR